MSITNPLDLSSLCQVYPCGMVLEVFWGVFEGYTSPRVLVECLGRSLCSDVLSSHLLYKHAQCKTCTV